MPSRDDYSKISEYISRSGIELSGPLTFSSSHESDVTAFIITRLNAEKKQQPSNVFLKKIAREIETIFQLKLEFVLTNNDLQEVESQVRANFLFQFGEYLRNSFLSTVDGHTTLWLDAKVSLNEKTQSAIRDHGHKLLALYNVKLDDVVLTSGENTPGKIAILSAVRRRSPVKLVELSTQLRGQGFSVPSEDWLSRRLDNLRRTGFVIRQQSEAYSLTSHAITTLGTSRTKRSPDIARILALGRGEG